MFIGFVLGVYVAERRRVGATPAWPSTTGALRGGGRLDPDRAGGGVPGRCRLGRRCRGDLMVVLLSLGAALAYGLSDFVGGLASRRTSAWPVAFVGTASALAGALAPRPDHRGQPDRRRPVVGRPGRHRHRGGRRVPLPRPGGGADGRRGADLRGGGGPRAGHRRRRHRRAPRADRLAGDRGRGSRHLVRQPRAGRVGRPGRRHRRRCAGRSRVRPAVRRHGPGPRVGRLLAARRRAGRGGGVRRAHGHGARRPLGPRPPLPGLGGRGRAAGHGGGRRVPAGHADRAAHRGRRW